MNKNTRFKNGTIKIPKNKRTQRVTAAACVIFVIALACLVTLNTLILHLDNLPTWDDFYKSSGLNTSITSGADVSVHFIDVGQGDCELIMANGCNVLIDSGEKEYYPTVANYLNAQGISKLDYIIVTHPHSDHAGAMSDILNSFYVGKLIMPKLKEDMIPDTSTYKSLIEAADNDRIPIEYAKSGTEIDLGGSVLQILAPLDDYDNLNDYSVVTRFINGTNKFLFLGDIEEGAEDDILASGYDISADVVKIAHHGSSTSSKKKFLNAVSADYAVIEVGSPNTHNHPNDKVVERIEALGMEIYRTDYDGDIIFESDGTSITVKTENGAMPDAA